MNPLELIVERPNEATAVLTLNRPQRRNALTIELMQALCRTLESLAAEPRRRVVILRGAGPAFCAGLDLYEAAETELADQSSEWVARTFETLQTTALVTVAAVHGAAYAGGAGLMACCDLVVGTDDLRICFPEVRRGLVPALAAAALVGRLRSGNLAELLLLGEPVDVEQALRMGLVDRVVPTPRLLAEAEQVAAAIVRGGPEAVRQTKQLLAEVGPSRRFARALEYHKRARLSDEACEGTAAFREHREPIWPIRVE